MGLQGLSTPYGSKNKSVFHWDERRDEENARNFAFGKPHHKSECRIFENFWRWLGDIRRRLLLPVWASKIGLLCWLVLFFLIAVE